MAEPIKERDEVRNEPTAAVHVIVLAALMALLAMTIGLALVDVDRFLPGRGWGLPLALGIAALKAALVGAYFMHLKNGDRLTRVVAAAGFIWLGILGVIVMVEMATR